MEKKLVALENPVVISSLTIIPVTRSSICSWHNKNGISFFSFKKPLYILVLDRQSTVKAFTIDGEATSPDKICSEYPELDEDLKRITGISGVCRQPLPEEPPPTIK